jgi:hypothetical protein
MPRTLRGRFIGPRADFHSEFAVMRPRAAASASQSAKVWLDGGRVLLVYRYVDSDALAIGSGSWAGRPVSWASRRSRRKSGTAPRWAQRSRSSSATSSRRTDQGQEKHRDWGPTVQSTAYANSAGLDPGDANTAVRASPGQRPPHFDVGALRCSASMRNPSRVISYFPSRCTSKPALTISSAVCTLQTGRLPPG